MGLQEMINKDGYSVHPTAIIEEGAKIGKDTKIWHRAQIRKGASLGEECSVGANAYIDQNVQVGNRVKIQNLCLVYDGVTLEDGVLVGPNVTFTNDLYPRAINPDGSLKGIDDWVKTKTLVKKGASLGAQSSVLCGITVGEWALISMAAVAVKNVPDYGLIVGSPGKLVGFVDPSCHRLSLDTVLEETGDKVALQCSKNCEQVYVSKEAYNSLTKL